MNILRNGFLGLLITVVLVASSYGASFNENDINITTSSNVTYTTATLITTITTSNATNATSTVQPITTAQLTTSNTVTNNSTIATTNATNPTTYSTANSTATTKRTSTTTKTLVRKFDGLSFIGGMILAAGLSAIIYLVVNYLRRNNQLPYANLR